MEKDHGNGNGAQHVVLVVDDEEGIRNVLRRHLTQLGYQVALAANGDEALVLAGRLEPAVIVADVHMPGMDGLTLLRRLNPLGLQSSVILMSGRGELDDAISALRQGAVDYLKKPWTLEELTAAVGRATKLFDALQDLSGPLASPDDLRHPRAPHAERLDAAKLVTALANQGDALEPPAVPSALALLRDLARRPGGQIDDQLIGLLERDPALAASVFRLAAEATNSPNLVEGDLRAAASAIGLAAIRSEAETTAVRNVFPIGVPALSTLNERIRDFALARAAAMRGIAEIAETEVMLDPDQCHLAGLWLDVGAMFLLSAISEATERGSGKVADLGEMTQSIATHHGAVGAAILGRWGMSSDLVELARDHHGDARGRQAAPLWCASTLGGAIALRLTGFGDPTGDRDLKADVLARCAYTLGVGDTSLRGVTRSLSHRAAHVSEAGPL